MDHLYELKVVVNPFWKKGANAGIESDIAFCDFYFKADFRIVIALN